MDTRDFSVDTIQEIYDIIETLKDQGTLWDSIHDYWCIGEPDAGMLCTYASRDEMTEYYEKYADGMNLTKKKFERIVENVREVDSKYQEVFLESKEELKNVGEMLKNMTEEISLRTVSLDTNHYNQAIGIIEGEDNEKKEELKALIGIAPGTTQESKLLQKIREILKYSVGNGGFEDEIEVESEEASIAQKQKLITQVESLKEKFKNKELTQEELLDKICEIYHVEDYGSQINYSLAFKKYAPEKKARIVSDILSTAMYIMEVDGLDAEKIEEIAQSVKAKSYIEDEIWNMAEHVFRGAVMGVNTAVAGKYYTGQVGSGGGKTTINGLEIINGKVDGKIPLDEYQDIFGKSIHNENSDTMTLGKFRPTINPDGSENWKIAGADSYNVIAHNNGDMYFDMKDGLYDATLDNYNLSYQNMFDDFNVPALDKAASEGKTIRFSHNPELREYAGTFTDKEWKHLQEEWGYLYLREEGGFWYAEK